MSDNSNFSFKWGAITLLDFLGWKGVWLNDYKKHSQKTSDSTSYSSLNTLAEVVSKAEEICRKKSSAARNNICVDPCKLKCGEDCGLTFISISDTIAIFNSCDKDNFYSYLKLHANICSEIMDAAASRGLALRGATTIGEYASLCNIIVGPGVDECSSWYEQSDWLGVIFAPSAQFIIEIEETNSTKNAGKFWSDDKIIRYENIPLKGGIRSLKYCVDWGHDKDILNNVLGNTVSLPREVAIKYINTNDFLYTIRPIEKDDG